MYSRFAIADDLIIEDLHDRLRRGIYEPSHACKFLLSVAAGRRLIRERRLSYKQTAYAISRAREGWVRAQLVAALNTDHYGKIQVETILNDALREANPDVSLSAALHVANLGVNVRSPANTIQPSGGKALRQFGILRRLPGRACGIEWSLARFTRRATGVNWKRVFGSDYSHAEKIAVQLRALADTDATAFVNAADVFNDILLKRLYLHDTSLGTYTLGNIGSVLGSARLRAAYPFVHELCNRIHDERLRSMLSHPVVRRTGSKSTGRQGSPDINTRSNCLRADAGLSVNGGFSMRSHVQRRWPVSSVESALLWFRRGALTSERPGED